MVPLLRNLCVNCLKRFRHLYNARNLTTITSSPLKVLFFGTDEISTECLQAIYRNWQSGNPRIIEHLEVVTPPRKDILMEVRKFAANNNLIIHDWPYCPEKNAFTVGVVVSFGYLIPKKVIESLKYGILNMHPSLLPRWRGAAPVFHAILNGDQRSGVTIMQIEPHKFDSGKILAQEEYLVPEGITLTQMEKDLAKMGGNMIIQSLGNLEKLIANSRTQDESLVTKAPKIEPQMAIIRWQEFTSTYIDRLYRALPDIIKLQTNWHGQMVRLSDMLPPRTILEINIEKTEEDLKSIGIVLQPGTVVYHRKRKFVLVLCQSGWVGFNSFTINGKHMNASDFYNGFLSKVSPQQRYFE